MSSTLGAGTANPMKYKVRIYEEISQDLTCVAISRLESNKLYLLSEGIFKETDPAEIIPNSKMSLIIPGGDSADVLQALMDSLYRRGFRPSEAEQSKYYELKAHAMGEHISDLRMIADRLLKIVETEKTIT